MTDTAKTAEEKKPDTPAEKASKKVWVRITKGATDHYRGGLRFTKEWREVATDTIDADALARIRADKTLEVVNKEPKAA